MHHLRAAAAGIFDQDDALALCDRIANRRGDASLRPDAGDEEPFDLALVERGRQIVLAKSAGVVLIDHQFAGDRGHLLADRDARIGFVAEGRAAAFRDRLERSRRAQIEVAPIGRMEDGEGFLARRQQQTLSVRQHLVDAVHRVKRIMPLLFLQVDQQECRMLQVDREALLHLVSAQQLILERKP